MSTAEQGLSSAEAARRLAVYGPNEPAPLRRLSAVVQLLHLFANPLVIILLVASVIAALSGTAGRRAHHRDDGGARCHDQLLAIVPVAAGGGATPVVGDPDRNRAAGWGLARDATAERCAWRRVPAVGRRSGARRRTAAGVARPLCSAIDVDWRVAARRQDRLRRQARKRDRPQRARVGVSRHLGRQRHRNGASHRNWAQDDVRRYRRATRKPRSRNRVRTRPAAVQPADSSDDRGAGACSSC